MLLLLLVDGEYLLALNTTLAEIRVVGWAIHHRSSILGDANWLEIWPQIDYCDPAGILTVPLQKTTEVLNYIATVLVSYLR